MKINFKQIGNAIKNTVAKHLPLIGVVTGITGMAATVIIVYEKADEMHQKAEEIHANEELTTPQKIFAYGKVYAVPATTFVASTASILGGLYVSNSRNKKLVASNLALSSAATIAQQELIQWRNETLEKVGEGTYEEIKESVSKKKFDEYKSKEPEKFTEILSEDTPSGCELYWEPILGHLFYSNWKKIMLAERENNSRMYSGELVPMTSWYGLLNIPVELAGDIGNNLFFSVDSGTKYNLEVTKYPDKTPDGRLCWRLEYNKDPIILP